MLGAVLIFKTLPTKANEIPFSLYRVISMEIFPAIFVFEIFTINIITVFLGGNGYFGSTN